MSDCCDNTWLACAIDSEGTFNVSIQRKKCVTGYRSEFRAPSGRVRIANSDEDYILHIMEILDSWEVTYHVEEQHRDDTSKNLQKVPVVYGISITHHAGIVEVLKRIIPQLYAKKEFAICLLGLLSARIRVVAVTRQAEPWSYEHTVAATAMRKTYMPRSTRTHGETLTGFEEEKAALDRVYRLGLEVLKAIPSEALGSANSTKESLESRSVNSTSNNPIHERPAPLHVANGDCEEMMYSDPQRNLGEGGNPSKT